MISHLINFNMAVYSTPVQHVTHYWTIQGDWILIFSLFLLSVDMIFFFYNIAASETLQIGNPAACLAELVLGGHEI